LYSRSRIHSPPRCAAGDWLCPQCGNHNYHFRTECNKCKTAKPAGLPDAAAGAMAGKRGRDDGMMGGGGGKRLQAPVQGMVCAPPSFPVESQR
jgi:hypothetical protein